MLLADNRRVARMGLTHPELAEPLFHWFNLLETDIGVVWSNHSWDDLAGFLYNGREVRLRGTGTKGGQKSIFDDGIEGAIDMDLWREPGDDEIAFLREKYATLTDEQFKLLLDKLFRIHTGEMEPQYIMRYGFYEGHTEYRAEPIAIALVFGLRTVEEVEDRVSRRAVRGADAALYRRPLRTASPIPDFCGPLGTFCLEPARLSCRVAAVPAGKLITPPHRPRGTV